MSEDLSCLLAPISPVTSDDEDEVEQKPVAQARGLLEFAIATGIVRDHNRVALEDQCRKLTVEQAFSGRHGALDRHKQTKQAELLYNKKEFVIETLNQAVPALKQVTDLSSFLEIFFDIAKEHMKRRECERFLNIGRDLYIMAGTIVGLFRADEDYRAKKIADFAVRNFHNEAEKFLDREQQMELDRQNTAKRKRDDDEEEMRKMEEEEEKKRIEEETSEFAEQEYQRWRDLFYYDPIRHATLVFNGYTEAQADEICENEAREARMADEIVVPVVSSPPRSEYDPTEAEIDALDIAGLVIEQELSAGTPRAPPVVDQSHSKVLRGAERSRQRHEALAQQQQQAALHDDVEMVDDDVIEVLPVPVPPREEPIDSRMEEDGDYEEAQPDLAHLLQGPRDDPDKWQTWRDQREAAAAAAAQSQQDNRDWESRRDRREELTSSHPQHDYRYDQRDHREDSAQSQAYHDPRYDQRDQREVQPQYDRNEWERPRGYDAAAAQHQYDIRYREDQIDRRDEPTSPYHQHDHRYRKEQRGYDAAAAQHQYDNRYQDSWRDNRDPAAAVQQQYERNRLENQRDHHQAATAPQSQFDPRNFERQRDHRGAATPAAPQRYELNEWEKRGQLPTVPRQYDNRGRESQRGHRDEAAAPHLHDRRERESRRVQHQAAIAPQSQYDRRDDGKQRNQHQAETAVQCDRNQWEKPRDPRAATTTVQRQNDRRELERQKDPHVATTTVQRQNDRRELEKQKDHRDATTTVQPQSHLRELKTQKDVDREDEWDAVCEAVDQLEMQRDQQERRRPAHEDAVYVEDIRTDNKILAGYKKKLKVEDMHKLIGQAVAREKHFLLEKRREWTENAAAAEARKGRGSVENEQASTMNNDGIRMKKFANIDERRPRAPQVDYGHLEQTKSILKKREKNEPALLSDVRADCIVQGRSLEEEQQRQRLQRGVVALQRSFKLHPRKSVKFCDAFDKKHEVRSYNMEAEQVDHGPFATFDPTDSGADRLIGTEQMHFLSKLISGDGRFSWRSLDFRRSAGDCHSSRTGKFADARFKLHFYLAGPIVELKPRADPIFTRETAGMGKNPKGEDSREYTVSHRDYKIILAMRQMPDATIMTQWRENAKMMLSHAFEFALNRNLLQTAFQSGLTHLIFSDSLLDRVNSYRFPQAYFLCHQHPLTLSSSFQLLCNEIPGIQLTNIEWFLFAYGFDEIVFQGQDPQDVAFTVMQHAYCTMSLVLAMHSVFSDSHPCAVQPKFRVFRLPKEGMDRSITKWIDKFNVTLEKSYTPAEKIDFSIVNWEDEKIIKNGVELAKTRATKKKEAEESKLRNEMAAYKDDDEGKEAKAVIQAKIDGLKLSYMYNCVDGFAGAANNSCAMRQARVPNTTDARVFQKKRVSAEVHGLSDDEKERYY